MMVYQFSYRSKEKLDLSHINFNITLLSMLRLVNSTRRDNVGVAVVPRLEDWRVGAVATVVLPISPTPRQWNGAVAQWKEHWTANPKAVGPTRPTILLWMAAYGST